MGRKKVITEEIVDEPTKPVTDFAMPGTALDDDPIAEFDRQFPNGNKKYKVARRTPTGLVHVFTTTDVFDEDFLQENYGGGTFVVRLYVDGIKERETEMRVEGKSNPNPGTQASGTNTKTESISDGPHSFMESLMLKLLTERNAPPTQSTTTVGELAAALTAVHSITGGNNNGGGGKDWSEGFKAGVELAKTMTQAEPGDWKSLAVDALKTIVPQVAGAVTQMTAAKQPQPTSIPMPSATMPAISVGPSGVTPLKQTLDSEQQIVYNAIQQLKGYCMMRQDPQLIVDWAVANTNNAETQAIVRRVFTTDFSAFVAIDAEIGNEPYATWFKLVYDGLRLAFDEADNVDDGNSGEPGDARNVTDNVSVSTSGKSKSASKKVDTIIPAS